MSAPTTYTPKVWAKLGTPDSPLIKIATPASATATTLIVTSPGIVDKDDAKLSVPVWLGIRYTSGDYKAYDEIVKVTTIADDKVTLTVDRGIVPSGNDFDLTDASLAKAIPRDSIVEVIIPAQWTNMVDNALSGNIGSKIKFAASPTWMITESNVALTPPTYATTAARDAQITAPSNGMIVYVTADGVFYQYISGAWTTFATGTTANASETVAGKVEKATDAEVTAGTETGGTGAFLFATPKQIGTISKVFYEGVDGSSTPQAVGIITPTIENKISQETVSSPIDYISATTFVGQTFLSSTLINKIVSISVNFSVMNSGNVYVLGIYAADVNHKPTGSALAEVTKTGLSTGWSEFVLSSPLSISASTEYAFYIKATTVAGTGTVGGSASGVYAGYALVSSNSGGTWTAYNTFDLGFRINGYLSTANDGKIAKNTTNFFGFTNENVSGDNSGLVRFGGIQSGFSNLVPGSWYKSNGNGTISPCTAESRGDASTVNVGMAISDTELQIISRYWT